MQVCQDIIECLQTKPDLLRRVITGDETWIFEYDPENKHQSCQWKSLMSPRPKKARLSKLKVKVMLITFFDVRDIVHSEFLPQGQTTKRSCDVCFAQCARRDKSCGRTNRGCFTTTMPLLTTPSTSGSSWLRRTLPYWNNLPIHLILLCVTFFFSPSSRDHQGTCFEAVEAIKRAVMMELSGIPEESFQQCIEVWQRRMEKCIRLEGDYITLKGKPCSLLFGIEINYL